MRTPSVIVTLSWFTEQKIRNNNEGGGIVTEKVRQNSEGQHPAPQTIGERIQLRRQEVGMTQSELAEKVHLENKATISQYENNRRSIGSEMLVSIADALGTSPEYLLCGKRPEDSFLYTICKISGQIKTPTGKHCVLHHINLVKKMEEEMRESDNLPGIFE